VELYVHTLIRIHGAVQLYLYLPLVISSELLDSRQVLARVAGLEIAVYDVTSGYGVRGPVSATAVCLSVCLRTFPYVLFATAVSRLALGPTCPPIQLVQDLFSGG